MAVLQALVKSISPEILGTTGDGDKLTPEQARKLSAKVSELLGENEPTKEVQVCFSILLSLAIQIFTIMS
jgi:hypothetical protein